MKIMKNLIIALMVFVAMVSGVVYAAQDKGDVAEWCSKLPKKDGGAMVLCYFKNNQTFEIGETNVALGKEATASSTYSRYYSAYNLVDGSVNSFWAGSSNTDPRNWVKIDLGKKTNIGKVVIKGIRNDYYPRDFKIKVSTDDSTWMTVKDVVGNTNTVYSYYFGTVPYGRYLLVDITDAHGVGSQLGSKISEIEVYPVTRLSSKNKNR